MPEAPSDSPPEAPPEAPSKAPFVPVVGVVDDLGAGLPPAPPEVAAFLAAMRAALAAGAAPPAPTPELLQQHAAWAAERARLDWPDLGKYAAANAALPPPTPGEPRVVFIGDSITEAWQLHAPTEFGVWINRGISGQTTPQMLARYRADAIALKPTVIHLMAATNDIAGNTGPTTLAQIQGNLQTMAELGRLHGARLVLGSVPPAAKFQWRPDVESVRHIAALNAWLAEYAQRTGATYVDYHAALSDGAGGMRAEFTADGVHPNAAGYALMTPLARAAVG